jgi:hypothetical protein
MLQVNVTKYVIASDPLAALGAGSGSEAPALPRQMQLL